MRSPIWYRQQAIDCFTNAARIFGHPDQVAWLKQAAGRWLRIARAAEAPSDVGDLRPSTPDNSAAQVYECRRPLSAASGSALGELLASWQARHVTDGPRHTLPARRDIGVLSLETLLGRINIIAVARESPGLRFIWRLHGRHGVFVHGIDRTGKDTSTLRPAHYRELVERHYTECVRLGEPTFYEIESEFDGQPRQFYRRLLLPLAEDGRTVDTLVTAWDADLQNRVTITDRLQHATLSRPARSEH